MLETTCLWGANSLHVSRFQLALTYRTYEQFLLGNQPLRSSFIVENSFKRGLFITVLSLNALAIGIAGPAELMIINKPNF